jgi:V8-like Glu-specific endopeptidase
MNFEGIVKLSNCSGALIRFDGAPETSKAIVMTNGHCANLKQGLLRPGEVLVNQPAQREIGIFDRKMRLHRTSTTRFLYATMTRTDVALYELKLSYQEIQESFGIEPFTLSFQHPLLNSTVQLISGYWEKGYSCTIEAFVPQLKEDAYTWLDSLRYDEACETEHGSSGSPVIEKNTRTVIGIHNTGNDDGELCTMNNPCEIATDGRKTAKKGIRYGQQTYLIYSCLDRDFAFNLQQPGCLLPAPQKRN